MLFSFALFCRKTPLCALGNSGRLHLPTSHLTCPQHVGRWAGSGNKRPRTRYLNNKNVSPFPYLDFFHTTPLSLSLRSKNMIRGCVSCYVETVVFSRRVFSLAGCFTRPSGSITAISPKMFGQNGTLCEGTRNMSIWNSQNYLLTASTRRQSILMFDFSFLSFAFLFYIAVRICFGVILVSSCTHVRMHRLRLCRGVSIFCVYTFQCIALYGLLSPPTIK